MDDDAQARPTHEAVLRRLRGPARSIAAAGKISYYDAMYACYSCGAAVDNPREVFRGSTCTRCGKDLKVCLNCRFHSPGSHWDCCETIDELVADKSRANFCTFFSFRESAPGPAKPSGAGDARKKLDRLFGNG